MKRRFIKFSRVVDGIRLEDEELRPILADAKAAARRERGRLVPLVLYGLPFLLAIIATQAGRIILPSFSLGTLGYYLVGAIMAAALMIAFTHVYRPIHDELMLRHIRTAMQTRGHNLCAECGYHLTGHGDENVTCPECGTRREPLPPAPEGER